MIVGCQRPAIALNMVVECQYVGIDVIGTYAFLYFGLDTIGQTQAAIDVALARGVNTVWLDCESTGENDAASGPPQRVAELAACVQMVEAEGLTCGIYTGGWWWPSEMDNSTLFSMRPLWHSEYGLNDGTTPPVEAVAYGGWAKVAIHQYWSQNLLCGRNRDTNYVLEGDDMTRDEVLALLKELGITDSATAPEVSGGTLASVNRFLDQHIATPHAGLAAHKHEPGDIQP